MPTFSDLCGMARDQAFGRDERVRRIAGLIEPGRISLPERHCLRKQLDGLPNPNPDEAYVLPRAFRLSNKPIRIMPRLELRTVAQGVRHLTDVEVIQIDTLIEVHLSERVILAQVVSSGEISWENRSRSGAQNTDPVAIEVES
jgi:hypothetical protein